MGEGRVWAWIKSAWPIAATAVMVAIAAAAASVCERWLDPPSLSLFFVLPIVIAAIRFGLVASLFGALLGALALNFLFVEPRYTLVVARGQDAAALALFALVAAIVSAIAARARQAALEADQRAHAARLIQELASRLAATATEEDVAAAVLTSLRSATGRQPLIVHADGRTWGDGADARVIEAARWVMSTKQALAPSADAPVDVPWRLWPAAVQGRCAMALGVSAEGSLATETVGVIEQIAAQAAMAMERARVAGMAEQARLEVERERMKSELLSGVSHDLRTPLSSIVFALQSLRRFTNEHPQEAREELLALAESEARRLADMVDSLLNATRIGSQGMPVKIARTTASELIELSIANLGPSGDPGRVHVDAGPGLPRFSADLTLAAQALANIIANALQYSAGPVDVAAAPAGDRLAIEVRDEGPGLGPDPQRLFGKFVRGVENDGRPPGLGLGLALAKQFLESQGARVEARNRPSGGALFRVTFPLADAHAG